MRSEYRAAWIGDETQDTLSKYRGEGFKFGSLFFEQDLREKSRLSTWTFSCHPPSLRGRSLPHVEDNQPVLNSLETFAVEQRRVMGYSTSCQVYSEKGQNLSDNYHEFMLSVASMPILEIPSVLHCNIIASTRDQ